ncbi:pentatricopeptide repeat-containing protein [Prunus yedoensis var. nudiflora]|uniref:Pentatricopeptide repeat-containing protein n=1 Tax=Prunus yedoensis var. nudiflora TaxID=2094558 RepID=A0A314Z467_PRUYE|nr:pentatricopeptide repeat-containing protein [Prunus yedoensis var. nudiflora]
MTLVAKSRSASFQFFSSLLHLPSLQIHRRCSSLSTNLLHDPNDNAKHSNDAELISKILVHHHNPFHAMESSLQLHGITLSPQLLNQTLLRLIDNSKIALAFFNYAKSLPDPPLSTASFNLLIDILAKVRQYDVAWQLILEMDNFKLTPTASTFLILIRRLISSGLTRQAVRAFEDMETFVQTKPSSQDFCFLLDTLSKYGHVKVAAEVFNKKKHGFVPDVKMYTVLVYGWCKIGRFDMAERFLRDMIERGIEPNVVTYNVFLNGICRRASLHPRKGLRGR